MYSNLFDSNTLFIDEKVSFFEFSKNSYQVFNDKAELVARVNQKITFWQQVLRIIIDKKRLPFLLEITDSKNNMLVSLSRGWTFTMSNIKIYDQNNALAGSVKRKFSLKPTFVISDDRGNSVAQITGDYYAWDFLITDHSANTLGTINKKWAGLSKEIFTSADKYIVNINPTYTNENNRLIILASAITIDMILKNNK